MPAPILIAYASKYGSTQEVAESIGVTLREQGFDVDVMPMNHVRDLDAREAAVLGTPIYMGRLHGDASAFLTEHMDALASLPVEVFALGPVNSNGDEVRGSREQLEAELARYPLLSPVAVQLFGGKYDPSKLSFAHKMVAVMPASSLHHRPASDIRDWNVIRSWAGGLVERLHPVPRSTSAR